MEPMPAPSILKSVKLGDVHILIKKLSGIDVTRKTAYNWARNGRKNYSGEMVKLQTEKKAGALYTNRTWVIKFLEDLER